MGLHRGILLPRAGARPDRAARDHQINGVSTGASECGPASTRGPLSLPQPAAVAAATVTARASGRTRRRLIRLRGTIREAYHAAARRRGSAGSPSIARTSTSGVAQWSSHGNVASRAA